MADIPPSRQEKSLGLLTSKFVSLLQEAEDGVLDIKSVSVGSGSLGNGEAAWHWAVLSMPGRVPLMPYQDDDTKNDSNLGSNAINDEWKPE